MFISKKKWKVLIGKLDTILLAAEHLEEKVGSLVEKVRVNEETIYKILEDVNSILECLPNDKKDILDRVELLDAGAKELVVEAYGRLSTEMGTHYNVLNSAIVKLIQTLSNYISTDRVVPEPPRVSPTPAPTPQKEEHPFLKAITNPAPLPSMPEGAIPLDPNGMPMARDNMTYAEAAKAGDIVSSGSDFWTE